MKQIFNFKDRKTLGVMLTLVVICVFTLSIAYAALVTTLSISGAAEVVASNWDIHLANPKVKGGSATTTVPTITSGSSLSFNTTLNIPGDFYEFTVDVVNDGDIDAMIDRVVKTPELSVEQAKYLKYEISYHNGDSITSKQNIAAGSTTPIKVRVEYRKDLVVSDLPTGQVKLDLSLALDYIQSDGTGSNVKNNGVPLVYADGDIEDFGVLVTIGDQEFYTIGTEGNNVKMLAKHNLRVGNVCTSSSACTSVENATGLQDATMIGQPADNSYPRYGVVAFSTSSYSYSGSDVEDYVNDYKNILRTVYGVSVVEARILEKDDLINDVVGCKGDGFGGIAKCTTVPDFFKTSSYWTSAFVPMFPEVKYVYGIRTGVGISSSSGDYYTYKYIYGVRPVIVLSKDLFN